MTSLSAVGRRSRISSSSTTSRYRTFNHVGAQGSSGGLVSILNLDFIQQADFSAGAFGARHGNRAGSVTSLALRDGSTERHSGQANLASTGFGLAAEGPLGKGSYLIGASAQLPRPRLPGHRRAVRDWLLGRGGESHAAAGPARRAVVDVRGRDRRLRHQQRDRR